MALVLQCCYVCPSDCMALVLQCCYVCPSDCTKEFGFKVCKNDLCGPRNVIMSVSRKKESIYGIYG